MYVLFYRAGEHWPSHKRQEHWKAAAKSVQQRACTSIARSGNETKIYTMINNNYINIICSVCQYKVIGWLANWYRSLTEAEAYYFPSHTSCTPHVPTTVGVGVQTLDQE